MATLSRILAWEIPWTEEAGALQSTGSQRARYDWVTTDALKILIFNELKQIKGKKKKHTLNKKPQLWPSKKKKKKKELKGKTSTRGLIVKQLNIYINIDSWIQKSHNKGGRIIFYVLHVIFIYMGFPSGSAWNIRDVVWSLGWEEWLPTPIFLLRKSQGQRSLAGCSP